MSDLRSPIQFYSKNTCPMCREGHLLLYTIEGNGSVLGIDGKPNDIIPMSYSERVYCPKCNYQDYVKDIDIDIGEGMYCTNGSYRYLTEAERLYFLDHHPIKTRRNIGLKNNENPFMEKG